MVPYTVDIRPLPAPSAHSLASRLPTQVDGKCSCCHLLTAARRCCFFPEVSMYLCVGYLDASVYLAMAVIASVLVVFPPL